MKVRVTFDLIRIVGFSKCDCLWDALEWLKQLKCHKSGINPWKTLFYRVYALPRGLEGCFTLFYPVY